MHELKKLKDIKLSDLEKKELFKRISNTILKKDSDTKLSYSIPSPFFSFSIRSSFLKVGFSAIFLLSITSATAFASLDALPGDVLYGVKTNFVEKIPNFIYFTPESRAEYSFKKIENRVDEFERLSAKGKLTKEKTERIEKDLNKNFNDFDENIRQIRERAKDNNNINRLEGELEVSLEQHSEKIKKIREKEREENKQALESVIERVRNRKENKQKNEENIKHEERNATED
ncbi:MAG: DUF5667 domain-containing protein [Candidatus Paceibacterota bacterium]